MQQFGLELSLLSCSMAEVASTEQLPVKLGQEYRVKLGKSFTFPRENAYHTIKCESQFPKSISSILY